MVAVVSKITIHLMTSVSSSYTSHEPRLASPAANAHTNCKMTRSLYQVPHFELTLSLEERVATSRVLGRKETKCD